MTTPDSLKEFVLSLKGHGNAALLVENVEGEYVAYTLQKAVYRPGQLSAPERVKYILSFEPTYSLLCVAYPVQIETDFATPEALTSALDEYPCEPGFDFVAHCDDGTSSSRSSSASRSAWLALWRPPAIRTRYFLIRSASCATCGIRRSIPSQ